MLPETWAIITIKTWGSNTNLFLQGCRGQETFCHIPSDTWDPRPTLLGYNGGLEGKNHYWTKVTAEQYIPKVHPYTTTPADGSHPGNKQHQVRRLHHQGTSHVIPLDVDLKLDESDHKIPYRSHKTTTVHIYNIHINQTYSSIWSEPHPGFIVNAIQKLGPVKQWMDGWMGLFSLND